MRHALLFLIACLMASPAVAKVSHQQLLEMVEAETDPSLIIALVERNCVDFEVGPEALIDLSKKVPREVLQAVIDCSAVTQRPESKACQIYRQASNHPDLADFPFFFYNLKRRPVPIYWMSSGMWVDEQKAAGSPLGTFKLIKQHTGKHLKLVEVLRAAGVSSFEFDTHPGYGTGEAVRARQNQAILDACTARARLAVVTIPEGAEIYLDGRRVGEGPLGLELLGGEHELVVESPTYAPAAHSLVLREGETRRLVVELEPLAHLAVSSQPPGAIVLVNGDVEGKAPLEIYADAGEHTIELIQPHHVPHRSTLTVGLGESHEIAPEMAPVEAADYCYSSGLSGSLDKGIKTLASQLVGQEMNLTVPLYQVVTSTMENILGMTHVVDGKRMLFAPKLSKKYADQPWEILGQELTGWAFGETASDILVTPRGGVTITEVAKKKSSVVVHVLHDSGEKNAIYFDFTRDLKQVDVQDFSQAICVVFSRHEGFADL